MLTMSDRNWKTALFRGFRKRCPSCGTGHIFASYSRVAQSCPHCGEALHHQQADDAPPYFTIFIVGHVVIPAMLLVEKIWKPDLWIHFATWLPLTLILTLWLLPKTKGATVGLQWAFRMHGFAKEAEKPASLGPSLGP
jgi:uncharacterized protein (DUF983 family)